LPDDADEFGTDTFAFHGLRVMTDQRTPPAWMIMLRLLHSNHLRACGADDNGFQSVFLILF
jgi:hypothetical protein